VLGRYAEKYDLPQRFGKTMRVVRYKRIALPNAPLTEGVPPDAVGLTMENVDVTVEQWGIVALLTDVVMITTTHPALQKAVDLTGLAMAEMVEREIAKTLLAGTQVIFGGAAANRGALAAADKMTTTVVLKATTGLRARGARAHESDLYAGVIHPQVEADLLAADTTFQNASNFANVRALQFGEIGIWMGVRWARGNFLPLFKGVAAPDGAATTAEKSQVSVLNGGGALAQGNYQIRVVARDINSDYERKISQNSGNLTTDAGNDDRIQVVTPTSTNYVYDIYMTQVGATTPFLRSSRVPASTTVVYSTAPAGTEATPPAPPAAGVSVFINWVCGKDAYGRVELNGMSLQSYLTPAGASFSNPLGQGRKCGSKVMWKTFILDNAYFTRIEVGSAFADELPA
jgi:N4-gp56 family major capsid protein